MELFSKEYIPSILAFIVIGLSSAYLAQKRGKNPYLWFLFGILFGIFGILFLFFSFGKKKTSTPPAAPITSTLPEKKPSIMTKREWYFIGEKDLVLGPYNFASFSAKVEEGLIGKDTFVWNEELDNWKMLKELSDSLK